MRICKVCGGSDNRTLYALTARSKAIQNEWIEFIDRVHGRSMWQQDNVHLCHHHFSDSSFVNKFAYDRGFVQRLALQKNALPTILKNVPSPRGNSSHLGETVEISENLSSSNSMSTTLVQDFHDPQESSTNHYHYEPTVTMTIPGVDEEVRNRMVELAKQLDISLGKLLQLLLDLYCREFQQCSLPGPSEASDICTPVLFKEEEEADIEDPPMEVPDILHVPSPTTILEPASVPHDLDPDHEGPSIPPRKLHRTEKKYPHLSENSVQLHWTPNHESQVKTDIDIQVKRKHGMETELRYQPSKDTEINHQPSIGTVLKYEPHRGTKSIPQPDLDAKSRYQPGMTAEIKRSSCVPHHKHKTGFEPINSGLETADICEDGGSEHG